MLEGCTPFPSEFAERYIREGFWRAETIPQAIVRAAERRPDAIAVIDSARSLTYSQLLDEAGSLVALLDREGIVRGDRVVIQIPNCIDFATFTVACLEIGAIPIMALPAFRKAELAYLVSFANAKAIAIAPDYRGFDHAALARELTTELPVLRSIFSSTRSAGCVSLRERVAGCHQIGSSESDPYDVALFLLSGGTTGMPKLIPRTHADYLYNVRESGMVSGLSHESRILVALPAEHNFPLACPGLLDSCERSEE